MEILRSEQWESYQKWGGNGVVWWHEKIVWPTPIAAAIAALYGRSIPSIDCGYIMASG